MEMKNKHKEQRRIEGKTKEEMTHRKREEVNTHEGDKREESNA